MVRQSTRPKQNPKRRVCDPRISDEERHRLTAQVSYVGSPYHKRNPGDFGLDPPMCPRADKTECDSAGIFDKKIAESLLERGINTGLTSPYDSPGFPRHIWAVTDDETVLEARLDNEILGTYHGYPLSKDDPWSDYILGCQDE